jgi:Zn-dependent alcohol dehydrogenase
MKALVLNALGRGFDLEDVDIAAPVGHEVLVHVQASGLCHTDLLFATHDIVPTPSVLGHEVAGVVAEIGPDVGQIRTGDHVVGSLAQSCGACARCLSGRSFQCQHPESTLRRPNDAPRLSRNGVGLFQGFGLGGFAERALVHENQLAVVPKEIPFAQAALLGCGVVTGAGSVLNTANVSAGESVVIFGAGGVGLNAVSGARIAGASRIVVIDIQEKRLDAARRFGATDVIDSTKSKPVEAVRDLLPRGAATMKRVTLELGGKSPTIVLHDAVLDQAIPSALVLAFMNSGQACAAGTRLLVPKSRFDEVKRGIRTAMRVFTVGDPADPKTAIGPMVSQKQYERIQSYIRKGIEEGAEVLAGGEGHPEGFEAGYFVRPTVFANVKNDMTIAHEEIFGPVLCVIAYDSEDEAIRIANDSKYGLHAAVLGTDLQRARRVASQIRAGRVVINGMTDDPQAPWGGFKYSGVGREYGRYGIEAFVETRAILESSGDLS